MPDVHVARIRKPKGRQSWEGVVKCGTHTKSFGLGRCASEYQARLKLLEKAEKWALQLKHPEGPGWQASELKRPIGEHVDDFISLKKNVKKAGAETLRGYRKHLNRVVNDCGLVTVDDISLRSITRWLVDHGDEFKPRYLKNIRDTWRMFSRYLYKQGITDRFELDNLETIDHRGTEDSASPLAVDELRRLLRHSPQERADVYAVLALLGLRKAEAKRVRVCDVHLAGEPPHVEIRERDAKTKETGLLAVSAPGLLEVLARLVAGRKPTDHLLMPFPADATRDKDFASAGIPRKRPDGSPVSWHSFRKTAGQLVVEAGMHMRHAQDQLRHKTAEMTSRVYTRSHLDSRHDEFSMLPNIFECPTKVSHGSADKRGRTRTTAVRRTASGNDQNSFRGDQFEQSRKPKNFRELSEQKRWAIPDMSNSLSRRLVAAFLIAQ